MFSKMSAAQTREQEYIYIYPPQERSVYYGTLGCGLGRCGVSLSLHTLWPSESQQGREDTHMEPTKMGVKDNILRYSKPGTGEGDWADVQ